MLSRREIFVLEFLKFGLSKAAPTDSYTSIIDLSIEQAEDMIRKLDGFLEEEQIGYSYKEEVDKVVEKTFEQLLKESK